jgi:lysozyme
MAKGINRWLIFGLVSVSMAFIFARTKRGRIIMASGAGKVIEGTKHAIDKVRQLIAGEEGLRLNAYRDTGGAWTIGYGHLIKPGERFYPHGSVRSITRSEAESLFSADISAAKLAVITAVKVLLNDNQRAALESLAFNIGSRNFKGSTLVRLLNAGDYAGASAQFLVWKKDQDPKTGQLVTVPALLARRVREQSVFNA